MSVPTPWQELIKLLIPGEDVSAGVTNRPTRGLSQRTQHLFERLQTLAAGEALFMHDQCIEEDATVGDVVYYDEPTKTYRRALAAVEFDTAFGAYCIADSSYAVAMVFTKTDTDRGHLLTFGAMRDFDLSGTIVNGTDVAGPYFLSASTPGKITLQKPPVGIYILFSRGDSSFHFEPTLKDMVEDHIHYKFHLPPEPAGDGNCIDLNDGQVHRVINPDDSVRGWLPADDPIFNGAAPSGAKFGYNMGQHLELQRVFPPLPVESSYLEVNRRGVPLGDEDVPLVIVDLNGIWWMDNCYGRAPWPPELASCVLASSSSSSLDCGPPLMEYMPGHGFPDEMTIVLWFTKMVFKTDATVVTSLEPCNENEPISVLDCDGNPGTTGKLCLAMDFTKMEREAKDGFDIIKDLDDKIRTGVAVTKIKPGNAAEFAGIGVQGEDFDVDAEGRWFGDLLVGLEDQTNSPREGLIDLVALNNVRKEFDDGDQLFSLLFPADRASDFRGRVHLPRLSLPSPLKLQLWFWFVSRQAGAIPALNATFRRYPQPTGLDDLPDVGDEAFIDPGGDDLWTPGLTFSKGGEYAEAATPFFSAAEADTVFFTLGWDGDGLSSGFGIMRMGYRVELDT
jgi:hypothetical protein